MLGIAPLYGEAKESGQGPDWQRRNVEDPRIHSLLEKDDIETLDIASLLAHPDKCKCKIPSFFNQLHRKEYLSTTTMYPQKSTRITGTHATAR